MVEIVEEGSHMLENIATVLASLVLGIPQDVQLHIEQLLELQAHSGVGELVGCLRVMDVAEGRVAAHEVQTVGDEGRERLGQQFLDLLEQRLRKFLDGA